MKTVSSKICEFSYVARGAFYVQMDEKCAIMINNDLTNCQPFGHAIAPEYINIIVEFNSSPFMV